MEYYIIAAPEASDKPLHGFDRRTQQKPSPDQRQKCLQNRVKLFILGSVHFRPVLGLALFAENRALERREPRVQLTYFGKPFITDLVDRFKVLRASNFRVKYQGFRMR